MHTQMNGCDMQVTLALVTLTPGRPWLPGHGVQQQAALHRAAVPAAAAGHGMGKHCT